MPSFQTSTVFRHPLQYQASHFGYFYHVKTHFLKSHALIVSKIASSKARLRTLCNSGHFCRVKTKTAKLGKFFLIAIYFFTFGTLKKVSLHFALSSTCTEWTHAPTTRSGPPVQTPSSGGSTCQIPAATRPPMPKPSLQCPRVQG